MSKKKTTADADLIIPDGGVPPVPGAPRVPRRASSELVDAINRLPTDGTYFYEIRRRIPGSQLLSMFKRKLPIEEVDDIARYCFNEGGTDDFPGAQCDFRIQIVDLTGKRVWGPSEIQHEEEPRKRQGGTSQKDLANLDPTLAQEQDELRRRKEQNRLRRERLALDREERRIERQELGEDDYDDDLDGQEGGGRYQMRPMSQGMLWDPANQRWVPPPYPGMGRMPGMPGMPHFVDPEVRRLEKENDDLKRRLERLEDKLNAGPKEGGVDTFLKLMPFFQQEGLKPKDMLGMFGGMMSQMGTINAEATKNVMQISAESEKEFRKRMWDFVMSSGDDELIEKVRRWVNVGEEGLTKVLRIGLGRTTIKPGEKVTVPVVNKNPDPKGLPAPAAGKEAKPAPAAAGAAPPAAAPTKVDPRTVIIERVATFLKVQEEEMASESSPSIIAEKLDELYLLFPTPLREKIEASDVGDIYEELRKYAPETVDRILLACDADKVEKPEEKVRAKRLADWVTEFWDLVKNPDEDGEDDDDDEGDGSEPEPQPTAPGNEKAG